MEKQCFKCGETKPLHDFYKHAAMSDGHVNKCKTCNKADVKANRLDKSEYYAAYEKERSQLPHRVAGRQRYAESEHGREVAARCKARWAADNRDKVAASSLRYDRMNKKKRKAHGIVAYAIKTGRLEKKPCEACGSTHKPHAHHDDYDAPLSIRWLCHRHHREWHSKHGEAKNP